MYNTKNSDGRLEGGRTCGCYRIPVNYGTIPLRFRLPLICEQTSHKAWSFSQNSEDEKDDTSDIGKVLFGISLDARHSDRESLAIAVRESPHSLK